jgi:hypothetical protein
MAKYWILVQVCCWSALVLFVHLQLIKLNKIGSQYPLRVIYRFLLSKVPVQNLARQHNCAIFFGDFKIPEHLLRVWVC